MGRRVRGTGNGRDDVTSCCTHFNQDIAPPPWAVESGPSTRTSGVIDNIYMGTNMTSLYKQQDI
jgi:hypothetical protein